MGAFSLKSSYLGLRKHCYSTIQKDRKGGIYAEVEHGKASGEIYNVYADGTVLVKIDKKLYSTKGYNGTLVSHIRYYGKARMKQYYEREVY